MKILRLTTLYLLTIQILLHSGCDKTEDPVIIQEAEPVTDIEGREYRTIIIGNQQWMAENLNVSHFRNGDIIPEARTKEEWEEAGIKGTPAWCYYNNDASTASEYGKLYNFYAIQDPRGLSPEGWRVATVKNWADLIQYLGGYEQAGMKMKSETGWYLSGNGSNVSGFNGLPGGGRLPGGDCLEIGQSGVWWSASEYSAISSYGYNLNYSNSGAYRGSFDKATGLSVRAVFCPDCKDDKTQVLTLEEKLQNILDVALEKSIGKGISASVIFPDGDIWTGVSGISHGSTPISPDMLFSVGSIQKMFVGAAILQLAEEGKISLDDSLYEWLPVYDFVDSTITIRQLLNHTSGLYNFVDDKGYWDEVLNDPEKVWTMEETFLTFKKEMLFPKGTDWHYCQTGYNMLRMIIEKITGSDIPAVNEERFWKPLNLNHSFTAKAEDLPSNFAHGWFDLDGDNNYDDFSNLDRTAFVTSIGGEVWSTPEDLARWAKALFKDKLVVSQRYLDQMLRFYTPCTGEEFMCAGYGLSVVQFNPALTGGEYAIGHGGNAPGYAAGCWYLPDYDICIGLMENTEEGEIIGKVGYDLISVIVKYIEEEL
jgi:uncharacterized protein (TIGR02145 family)